VAVFVTSTENDVELGRVDACAAIDLQHVVNGKSYTFSTAMSPDEKDGYIPAL
jgi:hypothetical protein